MFKFKVNVCQLSLWLIAEWVLQLSHARSLSPSLFLSQLTLQSFIRHSFTCRSSEPEITSGSVGWKAAQLTPRSWPSSTWRTVASPGLNSSGLRVCWVSSGIPPRPPIPGETFFLRRPVSGEWDSEFSEYRRGRDSCGELWSHRLWSEREICVIWKEVNVEYHSEN